MVGLKLAMFYHTSYETQVSHPAQLAFGLSTEPVFAIPSQSQVIDFLNVTVKTA